MPVIHDYFYLQFFVNESLKECLPKFLSALFDHSC